MRPCRALTGHTSLHLVQLPHLTGLSLSGSKGITHAIIAEVQPEDEAPRGDYELQKILVEEAGVALNPGTNFGTQDDGFARLNVGCTKALLEEGLTRIAKAFDKR